MFQTACRCPNSCEDNDATTTSAHIHLSGTPGAYFDGDRCRCNASITFRRFPLVDMAGRYVGAFHGTFLSSPVLGLHPRLKGLHPAIAAAS